MVRPIASSRPGLRPGLRLLIRIGGLIVGGVVVLAIGLGLALETPWGVRMAARLAFALAPLPPGSTLEIAGARGGFLTGIELHGLRLVMRQPLVMARVDTVRLAYQPRDLFRRPIRLRGIVLAGPTVSVTVPPRRSPPARPRATPIAVDIDRIAVRRGDLDARMGPFLRDSRWRATDLAVGMRHLSLRGWRTTLALDTLGTTLALPGGPERVLRLSAGGLLAADGIRNVRLRADGEHSHLAGGGTLILPRPRGGSLGETDFRLRVDPLAAADLRPLLPGPGDPGDVSLDLRVRGDGPALVAHAALRTARAGGLTLDARAVPDSGGPRAARVNARATALDLGVWAGRSPGSVVLAGTLEADLSGPEPGRLTGPLDVVLDGTRVAGIAVTRARLTARFDDGVAALHADALAAGYGLKASGSARPLGARPSCDVLATLAMPPRRAGGASPGPGARTLLAGDLDVRLRGEGRTLADAAGELSVALRPDRARAPLVGPGRIDATLGHGVVRWRGSVAVDDGRVTAAGELRPDSSFAYSIHDGVARGIPFAALLGDTAASALGADFRLEGRGRDPATLRLDGRIAALTLERGSHRLEADSIGIAARSGRWSIALRGRAEGAAITARGALEPLVPPYRQGSLDMSFRGLDFARLTGDTALAGDFAGRIEASASAPDVGALVAASAAGRDAPRGSRAAVRLALEPSRWRHERISSLALEAHLVEQEASLEGSFESTFGRGGLRGTARPFGPLPGVEVSPLTIEALDLGRALGVRGLSTRLSGQITGRASGRDLESLELEVRAALDGSSINRERLGPLAANLRLAHGQLDAGLDARSPADSVAVRLTGRLGGRAEPARLDARGRARLGDLGATLGLDSLDAGVDLGFQVEASRGAGNAPTALHASGSVEGRAWLADLRLDTLRCDFGLDRGLLRLSRLDLRGPLLQASGSGQIALPHGGSGDSTDLRVTAALHDLEPFARRFWLPALGVGRGRMALTAAGPQHRLRIRGDVVATRLEYASSWTDSIALDFDAEMRDTSLARLEARAVARGLAPAQLPERDLDGRASWDGRAWTVEGRARLDNGGTQDAAFRLEPGPGRSRLRLDRLDVRQGTSHIVLQKPSEITFGDRLGVDDLTLLQNGVPVVNVKGAIEPGGTADLTARVDSLDVAAYMGLFGLSGMRGRLSGSGSIAGTAREPALDGALRGTFVNSKQKPARVDARMRWAAGSLDLEATFEQAAGQRLGFRAHLPLALNLAPRSGEAAVTAGEEAMTGSIEAQRFDFAWFQPLISPRLARGIGGRLDGRVEASGDLQRPDFSGGLVLRGSRVDLPGLGAEFEAPETRLGFSGRTITLEPVTVKSGSGRLQLSGRATLEGPGRRTFDLRTQWTRFPVMNTVLAKVALSGDMTASGNFTAPRARGTLEAVNSTVYLEPAKSERAVEQVELSEADLRELQERFGHATQASRKHAILDSASADVIVKIGPNVWVRRRSDPILALEMAGEVRVLKEPPDSVRVSGRLVVKTGRSYVSFLSRRFDLTQARIDLPGPLNQASAEIEALYKGDNSTSSSGNPPDVTATVIVGTQGARVDLQSVPYMDHASLLNYLATGQTQGEMASGTAYGLAVGSMLGAVGGQAGRSLGLQVVQVTQDAYGGQTLSAGSYVEPRLYLGFRQPVVEGQHTNARSQPTSYSTEFEVELETGRKLLLNLQGGGSQYRFLVRPRLGK